MCDELLMEAKPVFDHKSMVETVRDVLLNPDANLRVEDKTSLLASVAEPQPKVEDWQVYLTLVADAALPDAVFTTLLNSMEEEDVILFAVYTLCGWLEKDVPRCTVEIHALRNIGLVMLQAAKRHGKNMVLVSKAINIFCSLPDDVMGADKDMALALAEGLADVLASSHEHGTHRLWQLGSLGLVKVLSIMAHKVTEWQLAEPFSRYVGRLLKIVERNASHWEVFFVLQVISSFRVLLSQHLKLVVSVCTRVILAHTSGGSECTDRKQCAPDYETSPSWGSTIDLCLQMLTSLCLLPERTSQEVVKGILMAGRALLNCYSPGRKLEAEARSCIDAAAIEIMCGKSVVKACIEIIQSHPEFRSLAYKAVQLALLLSFCSNFPRDDLYRNGSGAFALLEMISRRQTTGLGSKEANDNEAEFQSSAAALLMMLTSERRYKMGILGRGYEQLWALVQTPSSLMLGLTALCHLSFDSPDAQEWLRKRRTDSDLMHLLREPMELPMFKMVLDVLAEMQSPMMRELPDMIGVAQMTAIAFYYSPRLSDTELTRDNSITVCAILKAITEAVIQADQKNDDKIIKELADCGYAFTLIQLLWFLDPEMAIWKEAAVAAFYFFLWQEDTPLTTAQKWVLHVRRTAEDLDPNAKQYRKGQFGRQTFFFFFSNFFSLLFFSAGEEPSNLQRVIQRSAERLLGKFICAGNGAAQNRAKDASCRGTAQRLGCAGKNESSVSCRSADSGRGEGGGSEERRERMLVLRTHSDEHGRQAGAVRAMSQGALLQQGVSAGPLEKARQKLRANRQGYSGGMKGALEEYKQTSPKFYDHALFPFLQALCDNWQAVRQEFEAVAKSRVHPWPETNLFVTYADDDDAKVTEGAGWNVFGLYAFNKKRTDNCLLCPVTTRLIEAIPFQVRTAAFSILVPGAHILPHSGYVGYSDRVLRAHLGLQVPPGAEVPAEFSPVSWDWEKPERSGCFLRAGDEKWGWREGGLLVFDDTHVHEAWNFTQQERVILLLDFTRPPEFMPPKQLLDALEAEANKDPFKVGNRGDIYLDSLTSQHGWEEVIEK